MTGGRAASAFTPRCRIRKSLNSSAASSELRQGRASNQGGSVDPPSAVGIAFGVVAVVRRQTEAVVHSEEGGTDVPAVSRREGTAGHASKPVMTEWGQLSGDKRTRMAHLTDDQTLS